METRILARYLISEGYDDTGDRCVDKDTYNEQVADSINDGIELITKFSSNGIGYIETQEKTKYGWETIEEVVIDEGRIFETKTY